ncbi:MAG: helix-turn-helix domain-containing protein [Phycisphaerales bacterium]
MAKMFYTLEEVAEKLGKSEDDVRDLATSGQLQEFRDRDRLMFKVEQVDLLAGGDEDVDDFKLELEDTAVGGSGLELSGTGIPMADTSGGTGISIFDTDHGNEDKDPIAALSGTGGDLAGDSFGDELQLEAVGSGSGLLDLTRESDDTSLGAELLEEVYTGEDQIEIPANASGLFEAAPADIGEDIAGSVPQGIAAVPMIVDAYDGGGSGLGVGMMIGALVALVCVALIGIVAVTGATPQLAMMFAGNMMLYAGALLLATIIFGALGWVIGRASE